MTFSELAAIVPGYSIVENENEYTFTVDSRIYTYRKDRYSSLESAAGAFLESVIF